MLGVLGVLAAKGGGNTDTILWIIAAVLVIASIVALVRGSVPRRDRPHRCWTPRGTGWGEHLRLAQEGPTRMPNGGKFNQRREGSGIWTTRFFGW